MLNLLAVYWKTRNNLLVLEDSANPTKGHLVEMLLCSEEWCVLQNEAVSEKFDCVKFHGKLLQKHPNAIAEQEGNVWKRVVLAMDKLGIKPHIHEL